MAVRRCVVWAWSRKQRRWRGSLRAGRKCWSLQQRGLHIRVVAKAYIVMSDNKWLIFWRASSFTKSLLSTFYWVSIEEEGCRCPWCSNLLDMLYVRCHAWIWLDSKLVCCHLLVEVGWFGICKSWNEILLDSKERSVSLHALGNTNEASQISGFSLVVEIHQTSWDSIFGT